MLRASHITHTLHAYRHSTGEGRYLDIYLCTCTHYTVMNRYRVAPNIFDNQFLQFAQSTATSTSGSQAEGLRTAGMRIIIIMITMTPGSGERCGRIKQWIIMELTYGIWAAAAPWIQRGSVAHTVTPCTRPAPPRPAPHQPLPSD